MERSKNNNKKRKVRNVERAMDGEENMGTKRRNGGTMSETMDTQNEGERSDERNGGGIKQNEGRGCIMVLIEYEEEGVIRAGERKKSNHNDRSDYDARHL